MPPSRPATAFQTVPPMPSAGSVQRSENEHQEWGHEEQSRGKSRLAAWVAAVSVTGGRMRPGNCAGRGDSVQARERGLSRVGSIGCHNRYCQYRLVKACG